MRNRQRGERGKSRVTFLELRLLFIRHFDVAFALEVRIVQKAFYRAHPLITYMIEPSIDNRTKHLSR